MSEDNQDFINLEDNYNIQPISGVVHKINYITINTIPTKEEILYNVELCIDEYNDENLNSNFELYSDTINVTPFELMNMNKMIGYAKEAVLNDANEKGLTVEKVDFDKVFKCKIVPDEHYLAYVTRIDELLFGIHTNIIYQNDDGKELIIKKNPSHFKIQTFPYTGNNGIVGS